MHVGSGGYVEFGRRRLLLTNEHVAAEVAKHSLARKLFDVPEYLRVTQPWRASGAPEDLAISPVDGETWDHVIHSGMAFPEHRFARAHAPLKVEHLLMMGFAGERAYYAPSFETLFTTGTPYVTQEFDAALEPPESGRTIKSEHFDPHGRIKEAIDDERAGILVELVLDRLAANRNLYHDVNILRRMFADWDSVKTHRRFPVCLGLRTTRAHYKYLKSRNNVDELPQALSLSIVSLA